MAEDGEYVEYGVSRSTRPSLLQLRYRLNIKVISVMPGKRKRPLRSTDRDSGKHINRRKVPWASKIYINKK